jgi:hypothetical protein
MTLSNSEIFIIFLNRLNNLIKKNPVNPTKMVDEVKIPNQPILLLSGG